MSVPADVSGDVAAVVVSGGRTTGRSVSPDLGLVPLAGRTLLARTLASLAEVPDVRRLVVVVEAGDVDRVAAVLGKECAELTVQLVVASSTPAESLHGGLQALAVDAEAGAVRHVLIHDSAWPLTSVHLVHDVIAAARRHGAAVPCLSAPHEVWIDDRGAAIRVPFDRVELVPQSPQVFDAAELLAGYDQEARHAYPAGNPIEVFERHTGRRPRAVPGESRNVHVRGPEDLFAAEVMLARSRFV